jgi:mRNA interferase MazF
MSAPRQGEIWWVDFDPSKGSETKKIRPAIVVSCDTVGKLPLRIVVPLTDWKDRYCDCPWFTSFSPTVSNGLTKKAGADGFQIKSISVERFQSKMGAISSDELKDIQYTILLCLGVVE